MPVAVTLSKSFYDRFGHSAVDELVGVINQVDAASQSSLREMNELNFARFEATLEQRIGELRSDLSEKIGASSAELRVLIANLATNSKDEQLRQMRWMVGMWLMVFLAVIGLWFKR